jgi:hypothetical protein
MTDKIEQVARALWDAGCREDHDVRCSFARAAIEAMHEPTSKMADAAERGEQSYCGIWEAMVDACLER